LIYLYYFPEDYKTLFFIAFIPGLLAVLALFLFKSKTIRTWRYRGSWHLYFLQSYLCAVCFSNWHFSWYSRAKKGAFNLTYAFFNCLLRNVCQYQLVCVFWIVLSLWHLCICDRRDFEGLDFNYHSQKGYRHSNRNIFRIPKHLHHASKFFRRTYLVSVWCENDVSNNCHCNPWYYSIHPDYCSFPI